METSILKNYSLLAFAREFGKMQVGTFPTKDGKETFTSCIFTNPTTLERTFVAFSNTLGVLSPAEIASRKNELQVVQRLSKDNKIVYTLCTVGSNNWADVDLGL